jgi:hypothetical protein
MQTKKSINVYKILFIISWVLFAGIFIFTIITSKEKLPPGTTEYRQITDSTKSFENLNSMDTFLTKHGELIDSIRKVEDLIVQLFPPIDSILRDNSVPIDQRKNLLQLSGTLVSCKYLLDDEIDSLRLTFINSFTDQINSAITSSTKNTENLKRIASRTATISNYLGGISKTLAFLLTQGIIKPKFPTVSPISKF